jgi:DNA-binding IclR family transcriptional regulator
MSSSPGIVRPAYCTGLGKALLAELSPAQLDRYLETVELVPFTERTLTDVERLRQALDQIKRDGIAFDDGEFDPEVRCVAVAVRNFTGSTVAVLGLSGPIWRLSLQGLQQKAAAVLESATKLSAALGYNDDKAG